MDRFAPSSDGSRSGTPSNARFAAPAETAEDLLKSQTVGLVHLDDFRKRRAEVLEQKERAGSGTITPQDGYVANPAETQIARRQG
jgi:protein FAM50